MNPVNIVCHPDGSPYTEKEFEAEMERKRAYKEYKEAQNYTHYSDSKNRERTADALESIADSLESIAADAERIADMLALFGQKGGKQD